MSRSRNRALIYICLIVVAFVGTLVDWLLWLSGKPAINAGVLIHAAVLMIGTLLWQFADARQRGTRAGVLSSVVTLLFAPLGSALYLHQSREWKAATAAFVAFWGGLVLAVLAANLVGNWLATDIIFGDVPGSG